MCELSEMLRISFQQRPGFLYLRCLTGEVLDKNTVGRMLGFRLDDVNRILKRIAAGMYGAHSNRWGLLSFGCRKVRDASRFAQLNMTAREEERKSESG